MLSGATIVGIVLSKIAIAREQVVATKAFIYVIVKVYEVLQLEPAVTFTVRLFVDPVIVPEPVIVQA